MCAKSLVSRLISITSIFEKKTNLFALLLIKKSIELVMDEKKSVHWQNRFPNSTQLVLSLSAHQCESKRQGRGLIQLIFSLSLLSFLRLLFAEVDNHSLPHSIRSFEENFSKRIQNVIPNKYTEKTNWNLITSFINTESNANENTSRSTIRRVFSSSN